MKIMCLNGWGGKLHEPLTAYLKSTSPDVLCLQEVVHSPDTDKDWLTYRDGDQVLPQRANFFRDVAAALPEHTAIFCPAAQGILWDEEHTVASQDVGKEPTSASLSDHPHLNLRSSTKARGAPRCWQRPEVRLLSWWEDRKTRDRRGSVRTACRCPPETRSRGPAQPPGTG